MKDTWYRGGACDGLDRIRFDDRQPAEIRDAAEWLVGQLWPEAAIEPWRWPYGVDPAAFKPTWTVVLTSPKTSERYELKRGKE